jgi:hypothetical protein
VFPAHIKGQWVYTAQKVPYYIDGGAGGAVYVGDDEKVGVDYGYWHGIRVLRVIGTKVVTDAVPIFVPGGITVTAPKPARVGDKVTMQAFGRQPTKNGPSLEKLELRSPDPKRPNAANLPEPARIWTTSNPFVAKPVAVKGDDARRNRLTQTKSGTFKARCPGRAKLAITSGVESAAKTLLVKSAPGPIVKSITQSGGQVRVALAQKAVIEFRRGGKLAERACAKRLVMQGGPNVSVTVKSDRKPVTRRF